MSGSNGVRTIAVTSGKGGVGKTTLSVNLSLALAEAGHRTCLFDADLGLANVNVLLGLDVSRTLEDALFGHASLEDIRFQGVHGIDIIPGSSGIQRMADLDPGKVSDLLRSFEALSAYDFFIMDTAAGIARNVVAFCLAARELILVVAPEPASMTDAYALLKVLHLNGFQGRVEVVVSRCKSIAAAKGFFDGFRKAVREHLGVRTALLGVVVQDRKVQDAVRRRQPVLRIHPRSNASRCIHHIARSLVQRPPSPASSDLNGFWERFIQLVRSPLNLGGPEPEAGRDKPVPAPAPVDDAPSGGIRPGCFDSITTIARELGLIRDALTAMASNGARNTTAGEPPAFVRGEAIHLDFDRFVLQQRAKTKGQPS